MVAFETAKSICCTSNSHISPRPNIIMCRTRAGTEMHGTPIATSRRDFLWALGVILSRGVSADAAGGTGLVPYLDFANHGGGHNASCERGFDTQSGCHFLRAVKDVHPGTMGVLLHDRALFPMNAGGHSRPGVQIVTYSKQMRAE